MLVVKTKSGLKKIEALLLAVIQYIMTPAMVISLLAALESGGAA